MRSRRIAAVAAALTVSLCATRAGAIDLTPEVQPGHKPTLTKVEAGLWMTVEKFERRYASSAHVSEDEVLNNYLRDMVCSLAGEYCDDIRVYVVRSPVFNAGMYPNGMMIINTGLLVRVHNEAQLAFVIGHELGHYLRRHSLKRWKTQRNVATFAQFLSLGLAVGGAGGTAVQGAQYAALLAIFGYGRDHEREADAIGLQLIADAGYDPMQAHKVWQNIIAEQNAAKYSQSRSFLFASHPHPKERVSNLSSQAKAIVASSGSGLQSGTTFEQIMASRRAVFLQDELDLRQFGRVEVVFNGLERHGHNLGELEFFRGEMYRIRNDEGDRQRALEKYELALSHQSVPAAIHRSMGMVLLKEKRRAEAVQAFETYLKLVPDAEDREMIQMYIGWGS